MKPSSSARYESDLLNLVEKIGAGDMPDENGLDNKMRFLVLQAFSQKNLQNVNELLLDAHALMSQISSCWSDALARFQYELK